MATLQEQTNEREERFTALYTQFFGKVVRVALKYTRNQDAACDLAQECFLNLYTKCDFVTKSDQQVDCWLHRVAQHKGIDYWRHQQCIAFIPLDGTGEKEDRPFAEQLFAANDVEEDVLAHEVQAELDARFAAFPSKTQRMIALACRGYSPVEIGRVLGVNHAAIKTRWYRMMCLLRAEAKVA